VPALEFPVGGSAALVGALRRGLERGGGRLHLNAPVEGVIVENGRAVGVRVARKGGGGSGGESGSGDESSGTSSSSRGPAIEVRARRAVVCSASVWDTLPLLPPGSVPEAWRRARAATPRCPSFMHLHLGFDAAGLARFPMHHLSVRHWDKARGGVAAEQNVVLVSVPTVEDETLRPRGGSGKPDRHALHAYTPATEPWELWEGVRPGTEAYERLKEERARVLWEAAAQAVGAPSVDDLRARAEVALVGTPHTHRRYLRRAFGSYGPAIRAGEGTFDFGATPLPGFLMASDSVFPGIGLPAVAAAGAIAANTIVSVEEHEKKLLDAIGI
jgi:phytoene dehydrogenase-like protein